MLLLLEVGFTLQALDGSSRVKCEILIVLIRSRPPFYALNSTFQCELDDMVPVGAETKLSCVL